MLTAILYSESSRLGNITGLVAERQSKTCAARYGNSPGERRTSQIGPGEEGGGRRAVARDNALCRYRRLVGWDGG